MESGGLSKVGFSIGPIMVTLVDGVKKMGHI